MKTQVMAPGVRADTGVLEAGSTERPVAVEDDGSAQVGTGAATDPVRQLRGDLALVAGYLDTLQTHLDGLSEGEIADYVARLRAGTDRCVDVLGRLPHVPGSDPDLEGEPEERVMAAVRGATRELLSSRTVEQVHSALLTTVDRLGGRCVPTPTPGYHHVATGIAVRGFPRWFVEARTATAAARLDRYLPELVADAESIVRLLAERERLGIGAGREEDTGLLTPGSTARVLENLRPDDAVVLLSLDRQFCPEPETALLDLVDLLHQQVRVSDHVGRLETGELVVVCRRTTGRRAQATVERLLTAWRQGVPSRGAALRGAMAIVGDTSGPAAAESARLRATA